MLTISLLVTTLIRNDGFKFWGNGKESPAMRGFFFFNYLKSRVCESMIAFAFTSVSFPISLQVSSGFSST